MKIAFITTEAVPFVKTGGLADVAGALPKALEKHECDTKIFLPKYYSINESQYELNYCWDIGEITIRISGINRAVHVFKGFLPFTDVEVYFIDCPYYFHRQFIYTSDPDENERFILFSKAVIETIQRMKWTPDIIHCNDWQTAIIPLLLKENYSWDKLFEKTATILTIHNIGYQGRFPEYTIYQAEINPKIFYPNSPVEVMGDFCFLKAGIHYSDVLTTVSKTYAKEILTSEFGMGLEQSLNARKKDLFGILNGVDYSLWNPETDKYLPSTYSIDTIENKKINKSYLLGNMKLPYSESRPLIGIVARLVSQKGFDIFSEIADSLMLLDISWIVLGNGESQYEELFKHLATKYPQKLACFIGYNNELSHLIEGGADMFLMPSQYEPCGLNQIYSLKYGTVPVVRKTGGLADTVLDWHEQIMKGKDNGTGFTFSDYTSYNLLITLERALHTYKDKKVWANIQRNGMMQDFNWNKVAQEYFKVYQLAYYKKNKINL